MNIEQTIKSHLESYLPEHSFKDVLLYSVFPAGKLFRPKLVHALAEDLGEITENHKFLASSIEIHHAYTLIHDDLPCMDDDDYRRGRESTHKKFNQWKAVLGGDALLSISMGILSNINSNKLSELLSLYCEYTGPRGLILGQVMDLGLENDTIDNIIKIHTLKTSRLIQLALEGSFILSNSEINQSVISKLGLNIGVLFQLLDDLSEIDADISKHELDINPFISLNYEELFTVINTSLSELYLTLNSYKLQNVSKIMDSYLEIMQKKIMLNSLHIQKFVPTFNINNINFK
jgi:geranylgeranyl pyrophosphate synthase